MTASTKTYRAAWATGFTGDDPLGFDAGDANLRRVVGNDPTDATDPSGLKIYRATLGASAEAAIGALGAAARRDQILIPPIPEEMTALDLLNPDFRIPLFADEDIYSNVKAQASPKYEFDVSKADREKNVAALKMMAAWQTNKDITVNVFYVTGDRGTEEFLNDAVKNGPGSINLYFGHGGDELSEDPDTLKALQALAKQGAASASVPAPLFGISSCFAGVYNRQIPKTLLVPAAPDNAKTIMGWEWPSNFRPMLEAVDGIIKSRLKDKQKVVVNLYFGDMVQGGSPPATYDPVKKKFMPLPHDTSMRYHRWALE